MTLYSVTMQQSTVTQSVTELNTDMTVTPALTTTVAVTTPSTTTSISATIAVPFTSTVAPINFSSHNGDVDTCTCNLHRQVCDLNCCCDKDCSLEDKKVFSHCIHEININRDTSFCHYTDYVYVNNTPYQWEVNQNGLFCIVKTNLPTKRSVHTHQGITSFKQSQLQKRDKRSWPDVEANMMDPHFTNESFVYGSDIWILKNKTLQKFELADSFMTNVCLIKSGIKYLQDFRSVCTQTDVSENNAHLHIGTYFQNVSVISAPKFLNVSEIMNCPKNVCLPIDVKECNENCSSLPSNTTTTCRFNSTLNIFNCRNVAQKIIYTFKHNGSNGFTAVELLLYLKDISYRPDAHFEFEQEFQANFFWHNSSLNYSQVLSGNPGYLIGKPVLIGTVNRTSSKIERAPDIFRENFLTFPTSRNSLCVLSEDLLVASEFGYNMLLKCKLRKKIETSNSTANNTCRQIQRTIFDYWPISSNVTAINKVFGVFGNSNDTSDWVEALSNKSPEEILNGTYGNFTSDNNTLICNNVTVTLKIDIFYARVSYKSLLNQNKIIGVTYSFGTLKQFPFKIESGYLDYEILIMEELMFYDVTSKQAEKFVDPPSFQIRLPYDFFYPFVKVDNGVDINNVCSLLVLLNIVSVMQI
ncbi:hypothetical protein RI129_011141 [Pyrocoelia pectoralis]|uniref:Tectonic domain-containing protein n=1 Tax=Pyrocoelia pectoralis TaxID=417401 RepID=A0AAN7V0H1_9COLE